MYKIYSNGHLLYRRIPTIQEARRVASRFPNAKIEEVI